MHYVVDFLDVCKSVCGTRFGGHCYYSVGYKGITQLACVGLTVLVCEIAMACSRSQKECSLVIVVI